MIFTLRAVQQNLGLTRTVLTGLIGSGFVTPGRGPRNERTGRDGHEERPQREQQQALEGFAPLPAPEQSREVRPQTTPVANRSDGAAPAAPALALSRELPKVQPFDLPMDELAQLAQSSGLSWVNSDAGKIGAAQAAMAAEPKAIHVPRERPAPTAIDEGPLVLVETKRDLRNMILPFEQSAN